MRRIVVLGTGTGVGKTHVTAALARALRRVSKDLLVQALKPVETGIRRQRSRPPSGSDAERLEQASNAQPLRPHPLYGFARPLSAHLEARRTSRPIVLARIRKWADSRALHDTTCPAWQIIETAGGTFSPLSKSLTNADLAVALDPAVWVLVAPDSLGVLHDLRATILALVSFARAPDFVVLSAARARDAATGRNAAELGRLGLPRPIAVVRRNGDAERALLPLARTLLKRRG
jgi:dethiobiotin synthetase